MPTCSGTQYHLRDPISKMEPNIPSITKHLEDLSTRFGNIEQELRSNMERLDRLERETTENVSENGPRPNNHTPRHNVQPDHDGMNSRNIKLEASTFDCTLDSHNFLDWCMSDERRIRFVKIKLVGQTRQYLANIEKPMTLKRQELVQTWDEMKLELQEKCFAVSYKRRLLDQWQHLTQDNQPVVE